MDESPSQARPEIRKTRAWALWLSFVLLLVLVGVSTVGIRQRLEEVHADAAWVAHSDEVLAGLARLLSSAAEAESAQRGYLLTGDARYQEDLNADLAGLGRRRPFAASVLTLAMLSLTGLPPTVGFIGKLLVFRAAIDAGLVSLALVGVFGSLVSAGYYLRVVYYLWMKEPNREVDAPEEDVLSGAAYILVSAAMLVLGVLPRPLLDIARAAARSL